MMNKHKMRIMFVLSNIQLRALYSISIFFYSIKYVVDIYDSDMRNCTRVCPTVALAFAQVGNWKTILL